MGTSTTGFPAATRWALSPSGCRPTRPWSSLASHHATWVLLGDVLPLLRCSPRGHQPTLGPLGRDAKYTHRPVKAVLRQAAQSTLTRKNATRATGKNGSCEIRIEK